MVVRDERWLERVNEPLSAGDLQRLRLSVERGQPYGEESWAKETARRLGLESTLLSRRRPRKTVEGVRPRKKLSRMIGFIQVRLQTSQIETRRDNLEKTFP